MKIQIDKKRKFLKNLTDPHSPTNGNIKESALQAGLSPTQNPYSLLKSKALQNELSIMQQALVDTGINPNTLAIKVAEGMNQEDINEAHKYVDTAAKLMDVYPTKKLDITTRSLTIDAPPEFIKAMFQ